ncbi:perosamine synthetase [Aliidongia dinghuensis]|uniref:Perosamine synthetase n=1 Tax=Aliidongia dinghuensis TaxID=1867774 RepID=A0A8J2YRC3_9PROT|nr:DegT/DnrJ/EryC1/StrS family aminotransferase [Aliidongia dinghuensis]GGF10740.1 perosamine synthetase [Aliidongia dinghuensis]
MIPLSPQLVPATFHGRGDVPSILDRPHKLFLTAGRMAFALGLRLAGVKAGDEVLIPAYASGSMVTPILLQGATPVFYRLRRDLSADLDDLAGRLTPRSAALLGVNFFGFAQDWAALRAFADQFGLLLVEDCAHALYGSWRGQPLGSFGDFAIASLTKFLPVWDGGLLALNALSAPRVATRAPSLRSELKAVYNLLEEAKDHGRNPVLRPLLAALERSRQQTRRSNSPAAAGESLRRDVTGAVDPARILDAPAAISRFVARRAARPRIAERRRQAYALYQEGLAGVPGCAMPFQPTADEVPFMAPVWVDDLDRWHPRWLERRLPMQRFAEFLWPDLPADTCPVARDLSRHLVQFPCHQDLEPAEIRSIIETIRTDLSSARRAAS